MTQDVFAEKMNTVCRAASKVVADVFNCTPGPFRPVAMAAIRMSVESAVATMSESDRAIYAQAMDNMELVTIKKERRTS